MTRPQIKETIDEVIYAWQEEGVAVAFSRLRETDTGLIKGHLTAESIRPEAQGHIWWTYATLSTSTDRDRLVKKLEGFAPRAGQLWERDIDRCFEDVAKRFTRVPESVDLADVTEPSLATEYLFTPVAPSGQVCLLLADQGATKSYLMLYLAVCTATGRESVFGPPSRIGPVVYFDWEVDETTARRRLAWICRGMDMDVPRNVRYLAMATRGRLMDRSREMRQEITRTEAVLAIVDSLTFATGADLNSTEFSGPTMVAIGALGEDVTKLVSAHHSKMGRRANADDDVSVMGSGLFEFRARAIWRMRREVEGTTEFNVGMSFRKMSDGQHFDPLAYRVSFDNEHRMVIFGKARVDESAELAEKTLSLRQRVRLMLMKRTNTQGSNKDLADVLHSTVDTIGKTCSRMAESGELILIGGEARSATGVWALRPQTASLNGKVDAAASNDLPF